MKKSLFFLVALMFSINASAQFLVENSGKAGVGVTYNSSNHLKSQLSIGDYGRTDSYVTMTAPNNNHGLYIVRSGGTPYTTHSVITAVNGDLWGLTENHGIYTTAINSSPIYDCRSFGVYSLAGNCMNGNYGVCGVLGGSTSCPGVGVYGSITSGVHWFNQGELYAGYFSGDVKATGTIYASSFNTGSDYRLKTNINSLSGKKTLDNVSQMNVVSYNLKQREVLLTDSTTALLYPEDSPLLANEHFGLIAQELKELYPNLVTEGTDGYLSINYIEIIPLLIQSIQELKSDLDEMKQAKSPLRDNFTGNEQYPIDVNALYQNNPNPFTERTSIKCFVSSDVISAVLYIYDMNGRQIDSYTIPSRGATEVIIQGGSLDAGIYIYSLITDGQVIDTKRMILTK